jgi:hypothetical protein
MLTSGLVKGCRSREQVYGNLNVLTKSRQREELKGGGREDERWRVRRTERQPEAESKREQVRAYEEEVNPPWAGPPCRLTAPHSAPYLIYLSLTNPNVVQHPAPRSPLARPCPQFPTASLLGSYRDRTFKFSLIWPCFAL